MKKNAKSSLALLLCLLMAGSTVACGGTTEETNPAADTAETTPVETEPAETTRNDGLTNCRRRNGTDRISGFWRRIIWRTT